MGLNNMEENDNTREENYANVNNGRKKGEMEGFLSFFLYCLTSTKLAIMKKKNW